MVERFEHPSLQIEVPQIIIHKATQPYVIVNLLDADGLSSKDLAEINFFVTQTDAATASDHDGFVVEGIVDVRQPGVGTRRRLVYLGRTFHIQSFSAGNIPALFHSAPIKYAVACGDCLC